MTAGGRLYLTAADLPRSFASSDLPSRPPERRVLFAAPDHFDVAYVINPHMADASGRPKRVDVPLAKRQWLALTETYRRAGLEVHVVPALAGHPDLVFTANQSFPFIDAQGTKVVIPSVMTAGERQGEVAHVLAWYRAAGWQVRVLDGVHGVDDRAGRSTFEGMGDALWLPGKRGILAGFGFRTTADVLPALARATAGDVFALELVDERFYHLDTAIAPLSDDEALWYPDAFTAAGRLLLGRLFKRLHAVATPEAVEGLACNAHAIDGRRVVLDAVCTETAALLERLDRDVITVDLSEFRKSGGSVFCLKMMLP